MVIISAQTKNCWIYEDCKSIDDYKKKLEILIDKTISSYGGCLVSNGRISLNDGIWGVDLSEASKNWIVENGKNVYDFRNMIFEWLFEHREKSK